MPADAIFDANIQVTGALTGEAGVIAQGTFATGAITTVTVSYTVTATDAIILANAIGGALTITLPDATQASAGFYTGQRYSIKKTDSTAAVVTVNTSASQTIDGALTYALTAQYQTLNVIFDGADWQILNGDAGAFTNPMTAFGDTIYGGVAGLPTRLAGNTSTTRMFWREAGSGTASAAPVWDVLQAGDLPAAAPAVFQPADPATTASTVPVMMGLGTAATYTAGSSGKVLINVTAAAYVDTAVTDIVVAAYYGTGTAPANGTAATGTRFGGSENIQVRPGATSPASAPIAFTDVLSLSVGATYWFDVALATTSTSDAAGLMNSSLTFVETS